MSRLESKLLALLPATLQARLRGAHAANKAIVRSAFWLSLFVLASKLAVAGKDVVVAYHYGTSASLEGYLFVFNLFSWIVSLIFSVMSAVFIPRLVVMLRDDPQAAVRWQRQMTTWAWLLALILGAAAAVALPPLLESGWLGLQESVKQAASAVLPWLSAMLTLGVVVAWHACQLMSQQRHANTFLEAMPAVAIGVAVLTWTTGPEVAPLLWGTLSGFFLQAALTLWVIRASGAPVTPAWPDSTILASDVQHRVGWVLAGYSFVTAGGLVDQFLLAQMPSGNLAAFGYANRVIALILTLTATVIGRAFLPVLAAETEPQQKWVLARKWSQLVFFVGASATALIVFTASDLVAIFFERGSFGAQDTSRTTQLLKLLALQTPFYLVLLLHQQLLWTHSDGGRIFCFAAFVGTILKIASLGYLITRLQWHAEAICLSMTVALVAQLAMIRILIQGTTRRSSF